MLEEAETKWRDLEANWELEKVLESEWELVEVLGRVWEQQEA